MYSKLFRKLIFVQTVSILSTTIAVIVDSSITSMFIGEAALLASGLAMPLVMFFAAPVGALFFILFMGAGRSIWLFYIIGETVTLIVTMLLRGKENKTELLDREIYIEDHDRADAAADMFRQILTENSITDGKMELVDRMLKTISEIYANAEQQKAELNLRIYETGSELRCSIETELIDPVGRYEQMAHQDKNSISFSEVFGLKRIVVEDLRNE